MKLVSNSLLTLCLHPFSCIPEVEVPRDRIFTPGRHLTPFFVHQGNRPNHRSILLSMSCPPRSLVRSWLGEGRIRSLLHGVFLSLLVLLAAPIPVRAIASADQIINIKEDVAIDSGKEFSKNTAGLPALQPKIDSRQVTAADIIPILKSHFLESTSWKESEIEIRAIGSLKGIEMPTAGAELRLSSSAAISGQRRILAPIEVIQDGKNLRNFWVSAEVCIHANVVTAARRIAPGKIVAADDIANKYTEIANLHAAYAGNPEEVLGKTSRRSFSPGEPLTRDSFSDPYLVRNGETVRLRLERDGVVLTSLAKAEQDGRLGQIIRVRNLDFSKVLKVQVTGRAEVRMQ